MSAIQLISELVKQDQIERTNNKELLEQILNKLLIFESSIKTKNKYMIGYYDINDLIKLLNISAPTIYKEIRANTFPKQVRIGARSSVWCRNEIAAWIEINTNLGREYIENCGWTNIYTDRYGSKNKK